MGYYLTAEMARLMNLQRNGNLAYYPPGDPSLNTHWVRPYPLVDRVPCEVDLKQAEAGMKKDGVFWRILVESAERNRAEPE